MNLLLVAPEELDPSGSIRVSGRRAQHLRRVLRVQPGQRVRVGVVRGRCGMGRVDVVTSDAVTLTLELGGLSAQRPPVELVLALPRPKVLSRVLRCAASFGVGSIDLINAWRVDKGYFASDRLDTTRLCEDLWLGCEQGVTTWVPEVRVQRRFRPFVEDELPRRLASDSAQGIVAHPHDAVPLAQLQPTGAHRPTIVAIGPEGGWIAAELDSFARIGFARVSLSERVLRVEAAVPAALAQLELLRRWAPSAK